MDSFVLGKPEWKADDGNMRTSLHSNPVLSKPNKEARRADAQAIRESVGPRSAAVFRSYEDWRTELCNVSIRPLRALHPGVKIPCFLHCSSSLDCIPELYVLAVYHK